MRRSGSLRLGYGLGAGHVDHERALRVGVEGACQLNGRTDCRNRLERLLHREGEVSLGCLLRIIRNRESNGRISSGDDCAGNADFLALDGCEDLVCLLGLAVGDDEFTIG